MALGVLTGAADKGAVFRLADGQEEKGRQTRHAEILLSSCTYQCGMRDLLTSCWDVGGIIALPHRIYIGARCGWYHTLPHLIIQDRRARQLRAKVWVVSLPFHT